MIQPCLNFMLPQRATKSEFQSKQKHSLVKREKQPSVTHPNPKLRLVVVYGNWICFVVKENRITVTLSHLRGNNSQLLLRPRVAGIGSEALAGLQVAAQIWIPLEVVGVSEVTLRAQLCHGLLEQVHAPGFASRPLTRDTLHRAL